MVPPSAAEAAREVLAEFLSSEEEAAAEESEPRHSVWHKIRLVAEALLFGWFIPRSKRGKHVP
jgi:hypothetical protein